MSEPRQLDADPERDIVMQHLVYFIKAKRYPWVKVGMSRDVKSLDKRLTAIAAREPFDVCLMGVSSSISEKDAHRDLAEFHERSEWFRWNKAVSAYVTKHCGLYRLHKNDDGWGWYNIVDDVLVAEHNAKTDIIMEQLHGIRESA